MSKLSNVVEGGLAGATTLSLLTNTLRRSDANNGHANLFKGNRLRKRFKKAHSKNALKATKQYIGLAGDLVSGAALFGLASLSKKKNAVLRGALLGTAAGLGVVLLRKEEPKRDSVDEEGHPHNGLQPDSPLTKALEVSLYTIGGAIAGRVVQGFGKKKRKKK